jgi:predicted dinucleotide-binding enzyme
MKIAVIGAGGMGGGLGAALARSGHEVSVGSRNPDKGKARAAEIGATRGGGFADAVQGAEVVFLAIPWLAVEETVPQLGELRGAVVVDVTNPYIGGGLKPHENSSDAEEIQKMVPRARVVKGWNTVLSPLVNAPSPIIGGQAPSVFVAADDPDAKEVVIGLAREIGYDPVDVGPLESARDLERLVGMLGTMGHGLPWGSYALKLLR